MFFFSLFSIYYVALVLLQCRKKLLFFPSGRPMNTLCVRVASFVGRVVRHFKNSLSVLFLHSGALLLTRVGLPALKSPTYSFFHRDYRCCCCWKRERSILLVLYFVAHTVVCVIKWSQWTLCSITLLFPLLYRTRPFFEHIPKLVIWELEQREFLDFQTYPP